MFTRRGIYSVGEVKECYLLVCCLKCAVPESIHTHPKEGGSQKFLGEGDLKNQELNWNNPGGMGRCKKTLLLGQIFSGTVQCLTDRCIAYEC